MCLDYPTWFFELLTEVRGRPFVLERYQIAYLIDPTSFKITNKTRQAGGSLIVGASKFFKAYRRESYRCDIVSVNQKEASDKITMIRNFWDSLPLRWRHPLTKDNELSIGFHPGRRRSIINSIAASAGVRGGQKDVVFDEAAHIPTFEQLFVAALPATIRDKGGFDVLSTPMGNQGKFAEIWLNQSGKYSHWARHEFYWWHVSEFCLDIDAADKAWKEEYGRNVSAMPEFFERFGGERIKEVASSLTWEEFLQEYCGVLVDEASAFFPWELLNRVRKQSEKQPGSDDYLETWFARPDDCENEIFIGVDFAEGKSSHSDATSIQVVEKGTDGRHYLRHSVDLRGEEWSNFDRQLAVIDDLIGRFRPQRVIVDETGLGRKLAQDLKERNGGLIEPVTFTNINKEQMALNIKALMERDKLWIPYDNKKLAHQCHSVQRKLTPSGNATYSGQPHDDMFWALALACKGANRTSFRILTIGGG